MDEWNCKRFGFNYLTFFMQCTYWDMVEVAKIKKKCYNQKSGNNELQNWRCDYISCNDIRLFRQTVEGFRYYELRQIY